ncbi:MAG TPA: Cache 3/Cache 2 fusion domain-containing protein [Ktedonobacterales bacterium]
MRHQGETPPQRQRTTITSARDVPPDGPPERRRSLRQFRFHRRFVPVMLAITLLSTIGVAGVAFIGTRALIVSDAQARLAQDTKVERQLLADQGAGVSVNDNRLIVGADNNVITLNDDTTLVDRMQAAIGANATIYQLEGPDLVAISTTLPVVNGSHAVSGARALGDKLSGSPFSALVGNCGASDNNACHHAYQGVVTLHGASYVAAFDPLYDMSGNFVGALATATPYSTVIAPCVALAVILVLIGLLMALIGVASSLWAYGSSAGKMMGSLDARLTQVANSASDLEYLAHGQVERAERQRRMALQVGEEARRLDTLASSLVQRQSELRDAAGSIWAEMSQPGAPMDANTAMRLAKQSAVAAGQMGTDAGDARLHCRQLVTLMNHVIAESEAIEATGGEMREHASDLRGSVEQVEVTVGERLLPRAPAEARKTFFRWGRGRSEIAPSASGSRRARPITQKSPTPPVTDPAAPRPRFNTLSSAQTGSYRAVSRPTTSSSRLQRPPMAGQTGEWPQPNISQTGRQRIPGRAEPAASGPRTGGRPSQGLGDLGLPSLPEDSRSSWRNLSEDFDNFDD